MQLGRYRKNKWLQQPIAFLAYGLTFLILQLFADVNWIIVNGLRLSCLLLVPYRFWAVMCVGEATIFAFEANQNIAYFGLAACIVMAIPPLAAMAPIVWLFRERFPVFPSKYIVNIGAFLACSFLASLVLATKKLIFLALIQTHALSIKNATFEPIQGVYEFLGNYVGIFAVVPVVILVKLQWVRRSMPQNIQEIPRSGLYKDTLLILPILLMLVLMSRQQPTEGAQLCYTAMFLPIAWLVLRHGWRGAAIGGSLVTTFICLTLNLNNAANPVPTAQIEAFMAFAVTCMLLLGARISTQTQHEESHQLNARRALQLAQKQLYFNELRIRQTSDALEQLGGAMQQTHENLLDHVKHQLPSNEQQGYSKQTAATLRQLQQLVQSMYPRAWRQPDLTPAIREDMAKVLKDAGVPFDCVMSESQLSELAHDVQMALYRIACEAVSYTCAQKAPPSIQLTIRAGETHQRRWVVVRVEAAMAMAEHEASLQSARERSAIATRLGASSLGLDAMRDYARIYDGELHVRARPNRLRITMLLHDAIKPRGEYHRRPKATLPLHVG